MKLPTASLILLILLTSSPSYAAELSSHNKPKTPTSTSNANAQSNQAPLIESQDTQTEEPKDGVTPTKPSQVSEIENSVYEESSEFESANVFKNESNLELKKVYEISSEWQTLEIKEDLEKGDDRFHLMVIKGYGDLEILAGSGDRFPIKLNQDYEMSYVPLNTAFYLAAKGTKLQIKWHPKRGAKAPLMKIDLVSAIDMEFNQNHRIITVMIESVRYKVRRPDLHLNTEGKDDRLQFILQSSLSEQDKSGYEEISMFVNHRQQFPNRSNFDFRATGNLGYGLIKTLNNKNKFYCVDSECVYFVTIYTKDIESVFFFPTVFANFSVLEFKKYLFLLEEVEGRESVTYELDVPLHDGDWVFSIEPLEGSPRMFVNPDTAPEILGKYKYKGIGGHAEEISITKKEASKYGFSNRKFFVTFAGSGGNQVSTFKFQVRKIRAGAIKYFKMDYAETGVVANDEINQYRLNFSVDDPEFISFELKLSAIVGKSMLVLKECPDDKKNCKISKKDIKTCQKYALYAQTEDGGRDIEDRLSDLQPAVRRLEQSQSQIPQRRLEQEDPRQVPQNYSNQQAYQGQYPTQQVPYAANQDQNQNQYVPSQNQYVQPATYQPSQSIPLVAPSQINTGLQGVQVPTTTQGNIPRPGASQVNTPQPTRGYYYPDQNLQSNVSRDDMINPEDIEYALKQQAFLDAQKAHQAAQQGNNSPIIPPPPQMPQNGVPPTMRQEVNDRNHQMIQPNQANLTSQDSQKMMQMLNDPAQAQAFIDSMMNQKDKNLRELFDYHTLSKEQQEAQLQAQKALTENLQNQNSPNSPSQANQANPDAFTNDQLQPLPTEADLNSLKDFDLEREFSDSDIRCVEATGGDNQGWGERKILMEFNCVGPHNSGKGQTFEYLDNNYVFSTNCNFAVGVFGANQNTNSYKGSFYSVNGKGGLTHQKMLLKKSREVIVEEKEKKYLRFDLSHWKAKRQSKIQVKIVGITGSCNVYLSKFNPYPTEFDNEATLSFSGEHFMSVRTSEKTAFVDYDTKGQYASLFASVEASEYCVLDVYAQRLSVDDQHDNSHNEAISKGKMVRRRIREQDLDENASSSSRKMKYVRRFHFEIKDEVFKQDGSLKVVLNSNSLGLQICLQANQKLFDPSRKCDIQSHRGVAEIDREEDYLEMGSFWAVGIVYETADRHPKLPVEFSLVYIDGKDAGNHLHLLNPGRVFQSHIMVGESLIFKVNLLTVQDSSTLILTSEDKSVRGEISLSRFDFSDVKYVLDNEKFAVEINHREQEILCREEDANHSNSCVFYVRITSASKHRNRFSLTYTFDDVPVTLKEGHELFIPNRSGQYFLYDPNPNYPAELNLESDLTEFVVYGRLVTLEDIKRRRLPKILNELEFGFKTDISTSEQLTIPQKQIAEAGDDALLAYYVVPKFYRKENAAKNIYYHTSETTRIMVKSRMSRLEGFTQGIATLNKGEFRHFFFSVENAKDFSLILTVLSGHADLYLNKGLFNLPTKKNFWKRRRGSRGEELLITTSMFEHKKDIKGVYTAGIYAESNCKVSIFFLPAFKNLINVKMQHLINLQLKKGRPYYFEFYNKLPAWDLDLYSANSDLDVSIMDYKLQKKNKQNLMQLIEDDSNYNEHLHFDKGSIPLKHHEEGSKTSRHYVIRVKAMTEDAAFHLAVYNPAKPLIIPSHKRVSLVGNDESEYIFKSELTGDFEEAKVDFRLGFGNLEFAVADTLEALDNAKTHKMTVPASKDIKFKAPSKKSDIVVFSEIFIRVKTKIFSKFSIVIRGAEEFHEIREAEAEIVYTSTKQDQFVYFYLGPSKATQTKSIIFDVYMVNYYADRPTFLFNPDDEDMELGKETKLLPMAILDYHERKSREFNHIELRTEVRKGYYVVKIPKANHRVPVKISVGLNDRRRLEVNGVYRSQVPGVRVKAHKYSVFLPQAGEFRFLVESCRKAGITHAKLKFYNNDHPITFAGNLYEAHHFLQIDDRDPSKVEKLLKNYNQLVFRGQNDFPGVLEFQVETDAVKHDIVMASSGQDYMLMSEFKPANRSVFFREYVELWKRDQQLNQSQMGFKWIDHANQLQVTASMPRFRDQLLIDYPSLSKVVVKMFIFVFVDNNFSKRLDMCGLEALEEIPHAKRESIMMLNFPADFNLPKPVSFVFNSKELDKFRNSPSISIFTYMSISFFESELEEFEINLDLKFTNVPYFHFLTANQYSRSSFSLLKFAVLALVFVFVLCLVYFKCKSDSSSRDIADMVRSTQPSRSQYENPDSGFGGQRSQIQMSNLSN